MQMAEGNRVEFVSLGNLISTTVTATSTKTLPQNIPLLCSNSFNLGEVS